MCFSLSGLSVSSEKVAVRRHDTNPLTIAIDTRTDNNSIMPESTPLATTANGLKSANDNITRFQPPSRVLSPLSHTLFHNKTRCFV